MDNHPIESLMQGTMENIRDMIDVNTIIGDAIEVKDGTVIIPISKVSFGFASGGSEFFPKNESDRSLKYPFGGAGGAGVSLKPVAFLVMKDDTVKLLSLDHDTTYDRLIDYIPQFIDMMKGAGKDKKSKENKADDECTTSDAF